MLITSFRNPRVKYLRSLRLRKYRQREGRFLVEGIRIVEEALERGAPLETLVYAPDLLVSERAQALVDQVGPDQRLALSGEVFASLSDRDQPQGVAAVIDVEKRSLAELPLAQDLLVVVAHQLRDPGNLGSLIRTADSAGATGLVVVEPSVDLYDPQTVRATMGSLFALPIVQLEDEGVLDPWYRQVRDSGVPLVVVATSARGPQLYYNVDYRQPLVLLVGSERHGLPEQMRRQADAVVRLPMAGSATSLNVSAAAAALIYEVVRQRMITSTEAEAEDRQSTLDKEA
ncbi:MAG: RNA methyltransferase [Anaerolineae bacterium]|nr:RNA methyltransferase [Anaerolineae bacterium]